jgi:Xaa-Pro aminopeptidase
MEPTGWKEKDDRNSEEIRSYLEREKLDAFIPWKPAHIGYLSNYYDQVHINILWEEMSSFLVIPRESEAFCVGAFNHYVGYGGANAPWWLKELYSHPAGRLQCLDKAADLVKKRGLGNGRIGIEMNWLPCRIGDYLRSALPGVEFVSADYLVPQLRLIKTKREQALLKKAAETAQRAMEAYMQAVRLGATPEEARVIRAKRALDCGGEWIGGVSHLARTGGIDSTPAWWDAPARRRFEALPRAFSENAPCFNGHFEAMFQNYWADLAWCQFYGPEPEEDEIIDCGGGHRVPYREARHEYEVLKRIQGEALQGIRAGMDQFQAKQAVEDYLKSDPEAAEHLLTYFIHGLGLEIHEEPVFTGFKHPFAQCIPEQTSIYYRPGAVVSSEWLSRYWTLEDPFVMTETGWEPLSELHGLIAY